MVVIPASFQPQRAAGTYGPPLAPHSNPRRDFHMTRTVRLFAVTLCLGCSTGIIEDGRDPVRDLP